MRDGQRSPFVLNEETGRPEHPPSDVPNPLLGPLDLDPERTATGSISFYVMDLSQILGGQVTFDPHVGASVLTVMDLVSGKSRDYRVPTSMGGNVNVIP